MHTIRFVNVLIIHRIALRWLRWNIFKQFAGRLRFRAKESQHRPRIPCIFYVPGKSSIVAHERIFLFRRHAAERNWTEGWELFMRQIVRGLHTAFPPMQILWSRTLLTTVCIVTIYMSVGIHECTKNFRIITDLKTQSNWTKKFKAQ